jgi:hypothetical protein
MPSIQRRVIVVEAAGEGGASPDSSGDQHRPGLKRRWRLSRVGGEPRGARKSNRRKGVEERNKADQSPLVPAPEQAGGGQERAARRSQGRHGRVRACASEERGASRVSIEERMAESQRRAAAPEAAGDGRGGNRRQHIARRAACALM